MNVRRTSSTRPTVAPAGVSSPVRRLAIAARTLALAGTAACASAGGYEGDSGATSYGRRDERQLVASYGDIRAVGVSRRYVYAASPSGIAVYDRVINAWQYPLTRDNGFLDDQITAIAGDPVEDALWYGVPGGIVVYRPGTEQLQRTMLPGIPDFIAFDRSGTGDAIVRAGGSWTRVSRVGITSPLMTQPSPASLLLPRTLPDLLEQFPQLRSPSFLGLREQRADRALRNYQITSGAASPERASEVWLGTNGDGLYRVDPTFQQTTALRYGPIENGIGALAIAADGVWMASLGTSALRAGLSFSRNDLQQWRWIDGSISVPLIGVRATAMSLRGPRAWIATERGVVRARLDGSDELTAWTSLDGLPNDRVYSILARDNGAWAGTAQGLVWIADSAGARNTRSRGLGVRRLEGLPVFALAAIGDTLWAGTNAGLVAFAGSNDALLRPLGNDPALRRPVRALAWSDTVLVAATDDAVLRLAPRGGIAPTRELGLDVNTVGQVTRLAIDERSIVMSGTDGVAVLSRRGGAARVLRVPREIPGPALDIAMSRDWLWIATPYGLVRIRRTGDGGVP